MSVQYVPFDGAQVSMRWRRVLRAARKDGVPFYVNSGHRTLAEQLALFRKNMHWVRGGYVPRPGRPLTAFPTPNAPHVLSRRHAHALDANNAHALARWLHLRGVQAWLPVKGENWHLVVSGRDLARLSKRLG